MKIRMSRTTHDRVRLVSERLQREYKYVSNICLEHLVFFRFSNLRFSEFPLDISSAVWSLSFLFLLHIIWLVITCSFCV